MCIEEIISNTICAVSKQQDPTLLTPNTRQTPLYNLRMCRPIKDNMIDPGPTLEALDDVTVR